MVSKRVEMKCCPADDNLELPPSVRLAVQRIGGINKIVSALPRDETLRNLANAHEALSDAVRMKILFALAEADLCPCILKRIADVPDSKLSYHLRTLENASLVKSKRKGRWVIYSITAKGLKMIGRQDIRRSSL